MKFLQLLPQSNKLSLLLISSLFLFLGDAILSYLFPVLVEQTVLSFTLVGIIMATSSTAGLIFDLIFPIFFPSLSWRTNHAIGVVLGLLFPITLFLGRDLNQPILFVISAICWGVYYEFLGFARQEAIVEIDKEKNFTKTWGIMYSFLSFCAFVGPIVASITLSADQVVARAVVFILYFISIIFALVLLRIPDDKNLTINRESKFLHVLSFVSEIKYWAVIESKTYPMLLVLIFLTIVNSFFWTFGGLFGEAEFGGMGLGWILIVSYTLPELLFSFGFSRMIIKKRKKVLSFAFLILAGLTVVPLIVIHNNFLLLIVVSVFSGFGAVSAILMRAVFSDLESRAKEFDVHIEAIYQSTHSVGYIIGPLLAGLLVQTFGFYTTFIIFGFISIILGSFLLLVTPQKLKLPIKRLRQI